MITFCDDVDILKYESVLFGELHLSSQVLCEGTGGSLSGVTFTDASADFSAAGIAAGNVINLRSQDGTLDMPVEIISVDSATQLTVSVLRADSEASAIAPPPDSSIDWRISTFAAQAAETAIQLCRFYNIETQDQTAERYVSNIMDTSLLRRHRGTHLQPGQQARGAHGQPGRETLHGRRRQAEQALRRNQDTPL